MNKLEWEMQAYGSPRESVLESIRNSITFKFSGPGMIVASYLSDAQEVLEYDTNLARQYINIAKLVLAEYNLGFTHAEETQ